MAERFFLPAQFPGKFTEEMILAADMYRRILGNGFKEYAYATFDVYFISDTREKLAALADFLASAYDGKNAAPVMKTETLWELTTALPAFPLNEDNVLCWAADLLLKGFEFDCRLDGYGTNTAGGGDTFPDEDPERLPWYFEEALKAYNRRNFGASVIYFTSAVRIFPENPNAWYSRGIAKDQVFLHAKAREDYNKAIELAPSFVEAYINRGVNKDLAGEFDAALEDFDTAVRLDGNNAMAYFNRGNTRHNMGQTAAACENWKKARELGGAYAEEQLQQHCRP